MPPTPLDRLRKIALALPETREVEAWGVPTFRVKKMFASYPDPDGHAGAGGRPSVWCKSTADNQQLMIQSDPDRFFVPPYFGVAGWVGIYLDRKVDWGMVAEVLEDGWRSIAPKRALAAQAASPKPRRK